ncbi:2-alkyl-3-oxoalkanoate reductase [Streptomyces sp. enrichment culture]|uniref:SDR family oxidoreductase n=1 Tax=Streptomyces sp. enrichment culture TaxID=1795815 RepID=UPI003F5610FD
MRVFVTGASGWIGSAVLPELIGAGHHVLGLARSDASAATVAATGADVLRGDLNDPVALRAGAAGCDGVIHLAFVHDFTDFEGAIRADALAVQALGGALENTGKPFVVTAGTPAVAGRVATERDTAEPGSMAAGREQNSALALATADRGVRCAVLRLPRSVHGAGDRHGFVAQLANTARERGVAGYVGDGSSRWPAVHVRDAAHLYRLALENAPAGSVLHAVGDEGVPTRDIATAIGGALNLPTAPAPREDFGFLGPLLALDQPASATATRELLGWEPVGPGLIEDIDQGRYLSP